MRECFTERREIGAEIFFAVVFEHDFEQREAVEIAQTWKVFSEVLGEVSHSISIVQTIRERMNMVEKVSLGSREGDTVHPPPVIALTNLN